MYRLIKFYTYILCTYFTGQGTGFSVSGRIESGVLQPGDNVLVLPANEYASVKCTKLMYSYRRVFVWHFL